MRVLIIEDEFRNYNRLRKMLLEYDETMVIEGPIESVADARQWLMAHQADSAPDIVFSDIRLNDGLSFDALDAIAPSSYLVFTTAYDQYALRAFQYNGLAYLMKPIEEEELRHTIERIKAFHFQQVPKQPFEMQGLKDLISQMRTDNYKYRERFLVPYKDGFEVVNVKDVCFICTEFKDTRLYLKNGKFFSISIPLEEAERQLNPRLFFRVNRQFIVSIDSVSGLKNYFGGKLRVYLYNYKDIEVTCSRERASLLKEWLNK